MLILCGQLALACVHYVEIQLETQLMVTLNAGPGPFQEAGPAGRVASLGLPGDFLTRSLFPPTQPPPRPAQPTGGKKRKRASDDIPDCKVLKPLLSGSIPVDQFVQTLEKVSRWVAPSEATLSRSAHGSPAPGSACCCSSPSPPSALLALQRLLAPRSWRGQNQARAAET